MANEAGEVDSKDERNKIQAMSEPDVHVLAVDDSFLDRKVIERVVKIASYKVTCVESGDKALEVLNTPNNSINLVISDYCMPEMTGFDLLKRVKESPTLKHIPVVMLSSENVPSRIESCLEHGAEEFLLKPIRIADVKRLKSYVHAVNLEVAEVPSNVVRDHLVEAVVEQPSVETAVKQSCLNALEVKIPNYSDEIRTNRSHEIPAYLTKDEAVFEQSIGSERLQDDAILNQSPVETEKPSKLPVDAERSNGDIASDQIPLEAQQVADVTSTTERPPDDSNADHSAVQADQQLSDTVVDQPSVPCNKRKFSPEGFEAQSPERRPRLSGLAVA